MVENKNCQNRLHTQFQKSSSFRKLNIRSLDTIISYEIHNGTMLLLELGHKGEISSVIQRGAPEFVNSTGSLSEVSYIPTASRGCGLKQ